MINSALRFVAVTSLAVLVSAQSPAWGQCGGIGWGGSTTCVSGYTCVKQNDYYSQCIPGSSPGTPTTTSSTGTGTSSPTAPGGTKYWFSFGDSYTQTGFDISRTAPSAGNPFGNPAYPGSTTAGGENWIDYLVTKLNKSSILAYNFAFGGATIDQSLVTPYGGRSMADEVGIFLNWNNGAGKGVWNSNNTMVSIFIGINDIGATFGNSGDRAAFSDTLLNAEFTLVQKLYDAGARNFLFVNVPPVHRSPMIMGQGSSASTREGQIINTHNSKMAAKISSFQSSHSGVKTYLYDSYATFTKFIDNPKSYGFRDATTVGTGADIMWNDSYHPGYTAHKLIAQDAAKAIADSGF